MDDLIKEIQDKYDITLSKTNSFHISLISFYKKTGFLTEKQLNRLNNPIVKGFDRRDWDDRDIGYQSAYGY